MAEEEGPKIQIDSDWKAQAQAEKARLAEQSRQQQPAGTTSGARRPGQMPPANLETLVSTMATQALLFMGGIPDPRTGQRFTDLDMARHQIDMLSVLEEKTRGNLTDEETDMIASTLYELRSRYIQLSSAGRG